MSIIIDLIILASLGISIFFGYKNGLTKCIIKIFSFIIAIIVAAILFKPVSNFIIEKTLIDEKIEESIINIVKDDIEENGNVKEDTNLPKTMVEHINNTIKNTVEETKQNVVKTAANSIAITSINVIVAVLLFIIVRILLIFISALSKLILIYQL